MEDYPNHIAIIMDGNGRWANEKNKARIYGHKIGVSRVRELVEFCRDNKDIGLLTLYTFSSENWLRPKLEISGLMRLIKTTIENQIEDLIKNGIKIRIIGDISSLPNSVREKLIESMELTKDNDKLILNLAINYGSRSEIITAIKIISTKVKNNEISIDEISEEQLGENLYTHPNPNPDLLIRTGGESRLSNFLLWQLAYAEIFFEKKLWPDFNEKDYIRIIKKFKKIKRNFGNI